MNIVRVWLLVYSGMHGTVYKCKPTISHLPALSMVLLHPGHDFAFPAWDHCIILEYLEKAPNRKKKLTMAVFPNPVPTDRQSVSMLFAFLFVDCVWAPENWDEKHWTSLCRLPKLVF